MSGHYVDDQTTRTAKSSGASATDFGIAFLAVASGSLDVIAFLTLGRVFASAMTGNTALLGIALSDGDWVAASQPAVALSGFVFGSTLASIAFNPNTKVLRQSATLRRLVLLETICLLVFAIVWQRSGAVTQDATQYVLILLCSFSMGLQGIAAKIVDAPGVNTIVFTSTLVEIVFSATNILMGRRDGPQIRYDTKRQISNFAAYGAGALVAGLLAWGKFSLLVWLPLTAVLLAFACFEVAPVRHKVA